MIELRIGGHTLIIATQPPVLFPANFDAPGSQPMAASMAPGGSVPGIRWTGHRRRTAPPRFAAHPHLTLVR